MSGGILQRFLRSGTGARDRRTAVVEALESRILYSADLNPLAGSAALEQPTAEIRVLEEAVATPQHATVPSAEERATHEIVFVDASVADREALIQAFLTERGESADVEVVVLAQDRNGLEQMDEALAGERDVSAVHILAHGDAGTLQLGNSLVDAQALNDSAGLLAKWGAALTADADILLYGCDVAAGSAGEAFVRLFADATHADVAASTDTTGATRFGGDWDLEFKTGSIEAPAIAVNDWAHVLATATFQQGTSGYTGTLDTEVNSGNQNNSYGGSSDVTVANGSPTIQGLIRFDNLFGTGAGQIPFGSTINSASLTVYVNNTDASDTVYIHRMLVNWSESSTWNTFNGDGVDTDGNEARNSSDDSLSTANSGWQSFNGLEATLQAWSDGASNYGWVIRTPGSGANSWGFRSSEYGTASSRPYLTVNYTPPAPPVVANLAGDTVAYSEGTGAVVIEQGANATVTDADSANFNTGTLTVSFAAGADTAEDVLAIRNQGTAAGQIGVSGSNVLYGGTVIGTYTGGTGGANLVVTFNSNATPAAATALVRNITYQDTDTNSPTTGARTVRFVISDGDGQTSANYDATVNVSGVNDAPVLDATKSPALAAVNEDAGAPVGAVGTLVSSLVDFAAPAGQLDNVTDVDAGAQLGIAVTAVDTTNGTWWYSVNGGANWSALGAVSNSSARLLAADANTRIYFQANANYNGTLANAVTFRAWDRTTGTSGGLGDASASGGTTAYSSATDTATLNVNAVNDEQVLATNTGMTVNEGTSGNTVTAARLTTTDVDNTAAQLTYTVTTATANGTLRRSGTALTAGGTFTQDDVNNNRITYDHNGGETTADSFGFSVNDGQGATTSGTFSITVTPVNDAPVITSNGGGTAGAISRAENGTSVTTVTATDVDLPAQGLSYTIVGGADAARFTLSATTGVLTFASAPNFEAPADSGANNVYDVIVQVSDGNGGIDTQTLAITITDADEFDVGTVTDTNAAANSVAESAANGTTVGLTAFATDADGTTNGITYSLDNSAGGRFAINATTGVVTVAGALDRESAASHSITVRATSADGSFATQSFTVNVTDVDEFDIGAVSDANAAANNVAENSANGTVVGVTAFASDADATTNAVTYSLDNSAGGRFAINATTGVVTVAGSLDRESAASHTITVRATSADGSFATQSFGINVTDVDEFDVGTINDGNAAANTVAENAVNGTTVGLTAVAADADATTNAITYSLDDDAVGRFAINATTGVVTVAGSIDGESATAHTITVRATSADGSFATRAFSISVTDVDEFDVGPVTDSDAGLNSVSEQASVGATVGVVALAQDADATAAIAYTLDDDAGGRFAIDSATGVVAVAGALDYETAVSHTITVRATSTDGSFNTASFTIDVIDENDTGIGPIADADVGANAAAENAAIGTTVGITAQAVDPDVGDTATYSLDNDAGGRFAIDASTGVVTVAGSLDREAAASHVVTVRATSSDTTFTTRSFTITVSDVDEFDVGPIGDANAGANSTPESAAAGAVVGITAQATDLDATTNAISYSLDDDAGGRFTINASTGVVRVASALDRESAAAHTITVRASSTDGSFATQSFVINVTDVDEFDVSAVADTDAAVNTVAEDAANGTIVGISALATDADATTNAIAYSLDDDAGGRFAIDAATGVVTVAGPLDRESTAAHTVVVRATSADGSFATQDFAIAVTGVNDNAPIIVSAAAVTVVENSTAVTTVAATDADAPAQTLTYAIVGGADQALFAIDPSTGALTFIAAPDYEAPADAGADNMYEAIVQADDGNGGVATQTITVTVSDLNDAPVITSNGGGALAAINFAENQSTVTAVAATDADTPAQTLTYAITGGADAALFAIDTATGALTFAVAPDFESPTDADANGVYEVTVQAADGNGGTDVQAISVTVTAANDAPMNTVPGPQAVAEDTPLAIAGIVATDVDGNLATVQLTVGNGVLNVDLSGGATISAGVNGTSSLTLSGAEAAINAALASLTYQGVADFTGADTLTLVSTDGDGAATSATVAITVNAVNDAPVITSNGGGATANVSLVEHVTAVTTVQSTDVDGATPTYSIVGGADAALFSINPSTGALNFPAAPEYETPIDADADGVYEVTVEVADGNGGVVTQAISVTVTDSNDVPVIVSDGGGATAAVSVTENVSAVTTVVANDSDVPTQTVSYAIVGGADAALFAIDAASGALAFIAPPNFEAAADADANGVYDVIVQASDGNGGTDTQAISVTVVDANEAPVITSDGGGAIAARSVVENGTAVTSVVASDVDLPAQTLTYAIVGGTDAALFAIDPASGALTFTAAPDREYPTDADADGVYQVVVEAADGSGGTATQAISVTVTNANEAPSDIVLSGAGVAENAAPGTSVGTVVAVDPDAGDSFTFSLVDDAGGRFAIDAVTGQITVAGPLDFEAATAHTVIARARDAGGLIYDAAITVAVADIDETPAPTPTPTPTHETFPPLSESPPHASVNTLSSASLSAVDGQATLVAAAGAAPIEIHAAGARTRPDVALALPEIAEEEERRSGLLAGRGAARASGSDTLLRTALLAGWDAGLTLEGEENAEAFRMQLATLDIAPQRDRAAGVVSDGPAAEDESTNPLLWLVQNPVRVAGGALSAGVIWWLVRGGGLMTTLLMGLPAWRHVDLLPIIARYEDEDAQERPARVARKLRADTSVESPVSAMLDDATPPHGDAG